MVKSPEVKCEILRAAVLLNVRYPNQMERCNSCFLEGSVGKHVTNAKLNCREH